MINLTTQNAYNLGGQAEWCGKWKCIQAHVFIFSASLCPLVGAFNPFTFKLIIDLNDTTTFLNGFGFIFCSQIIYSLLLFLPRETLLAFMVRLVWWCWILLTSACLERFWFLHQIWRRVLLGRVFLVVASLSSLWTYYAIPFWLVDFLLQNQLVSW